MSQPRNKFIGRFKTQILKNNNYSEQKTDRQMQPNSSAHIRSINSKKSNSKSIDIHEMIVKNLEKHIGYLQKKLKDSEQESERVKNLLDAAQRRIAEKEIEQQGLIDQIEELNEGLRKIQRSYDMVRSDYQNLVLKQKMQILSGEVSEQKEAFERLLLKHQQHKKGRFSAAFLPSSFGSPVKYKQRSAKQYEPIIKEYQFKNSQQQAILSQQIFDSRIMNQFKLIKEENENLVKEINQLRHKNTNLEQQLQKNQLLMYIQNDSKEQIQKLTKQNEQLQERLDEALKENKRFLNKIAQSQQKMIEISMAINERSSSVSSLLQSSIKIQKQMQTQRHFNPEAKQNNDTKELEERIQMLTRKLQEKDEQAKKQKGQYKEQVNELFHLMKDYGDHIDKIDDSLEKTNQQKTLNGETHNNEVELHQ